MIERKLKLIFRGASISDAHRRELNLKACELIESQDIFINVTDTEFDELRESNFAGFTHYYLQECYDESELKNKADIRIYKQLLEIDSQLGTTQTEQLFECVLLSVRIDLIKV